MPDPVTNLAATPNASADAAEYADVIVGPPAEEFWERFNKRLEFPLSTVSAVLLHVLVGAGVLLGIFTLMNQDADKSGVPVKLAVIDGLDEAGMGSEGGGGTPEDAIIRSRYDGTRAAIESLPDPSKFPEIRENIRKTILNIDPSAASMPIADSNAAALAGLDESIRKKFLGAREGSGDGTGTGYDAARGKGPGGTGADSTFGRNMRWVLRFKVTGGHDYVDQLKSMGAVLLFPRPEDGKQCVFYSLGNPMDGAPRDGGLADDRLLSALGNKIRFSDARRDAVQGVAGAVGLDFTPRTFWAFFPKSLEDELARKEAGYRNKRSEDIEETIFRVTIRGGKYELVVDEQKMKR